MIPALLAAALAAQPAPEPPRAATPAPRSALAAAGRDTPRRATAGASAAPLEQRVAPSAPAAVAERVDPTAPAGVAAPRLAVSDLRSQPAGAGEGALAVIAVDAASAPSAELVEMTHQLRAACRERAAAVQEVRDMRAILLGDRATASLAELERAFAGAMLTAAQGDPAGAARTLRGIVAELELGPESPEAFALWTRAQLRVAHAELAAGRTPEYREALERAVTVDPAMRADPDQYSPTFRRDLDGARARLAALPRHELRIVAGSGTQGATSKEAPASVEAASSGARPASSVAQSTTSGSQAPGPVTVFVDGRPVGTAPVTLQLHAGRHRVGAAAGRLRAPAVVVDLGPEAAEVVLDLELAAAVSVNSGPALAVAAPVREASIVKVGAWLKADQVLAASAASEAGVTFLVGSLYDVGRGALLREGRVRTSAGLATPEHVAALSSFLLTGQASAAVVTAGPKGSRATALDLSARPHRGELRKHAWMRPAALGAGGAALAAGAFSVHQAFAARGSARDAEALLRADGAIAGDPLAYARHRDEASAARRNVWIGAAGAVVFAATAGALGHLSWDGGAPVVRF